MGSTMCTQDKPREKELETQHLVKRNRHKFKLLLIGESGVGKTSLITQLSSGSFFRVTSQTMGHSVHSYQVSKDMSIQLVDTSGNERSKYCLSPSLVHQSHAILLVYAKDSLGSLEKIQEWQERCELLLQGSPQRPKYYLVGTKADKKLNDIEKAETQYACFERSFEVSALMGTKIKPMIETIISDLQTPSKLSKCQGLFEYVNLDRLPIEDVMTSADLGEII